MESPLIDFDGEKLGATDEGPKEDGKLVWSGAEASLSFHNYREFSGTIHVLGTDSLIMSEEKLAGEVIEDPTLRKLVRRSLLDVGITDDYLATKENLKEMYRLDIRDLPGEEKIVSLEGLQDAGGLYYLHLDDQNIASLSPIKSLKLGDLSLNGNAISDFSELSMSASGLGFVESNQLTANDQKLSAKAQIENGKVSISANSLFKGLHGYEEFFINGEKVELENGMLNYAPKEGASEVEIEVREISAPTTEVQGRMLGWQYGSEISGTILVALSADEPETDPSDEEPENTEETDDTSDSTDDSNDNGTDDTSDNTNPSDSSSTDSSDGGANGTSDSSNAGKGNSQNGGSNSGTKGKDLPKTGETVQWGASLLGFGLIGAVVAMWKKRRKS